MGLKWLTRTILHLNHHVHRLVLLFLLQIIIQSNLRKLWRSLAVRLQIIIAVTVIRIIAWAFTLMQYLDFGLTLGQLKWSTSLWTLEPRFGMNLLGFRLVFDRFFSDFRFSFTRIRTATITTTAIWGLRRRIRRWRGWWGIINLIRLWNYWYRCWSPWILQALGEILFSFSVLWRFRYFYWSDVFVSLWSFFLLAFSTWRVCLLRLFRWFWVWCLSFQFELRSLEFWRGLLTIILVILIVELFLDNLLIFICIWLCKIILRTAVQTSTKLKAFNLVYEPRWWSSCA